MDKENSFTEQEYIDFECVISSIDEINNESIFKIISKFGYDKFIAMLEYYKTNNNSEKFNDFLFVDFYLESTESDSYFGENFLKQYLSSIGRTPLLTFDEEQKYARIVYDNINLIKSSNITNC